MSVLCLALTLALVGCHDKRRKGQELATRPDSGVPNPADDVADQRPNLADRGQVVPLLYGRWLTLREARDGSTRRTRVALDDERSSAFVRWRKDVDAACAERIDDDGASATAGNADGECGRDALYRAELRRCRAEVALAWSVKGSSAALVLTELGLKLDLEGKKSADSRRWWIDAESTSTAMRASAAMFAVSELRFVVDGLSRALSSDSCPDALNGKGGGSHSLAALLAESLSQAADELTSATRRADDLLRERLSELTIEDDRDRALLTRGLTDSLLERMKLYAGVPYGAFAPLAWDGVFLDDDPARYPVLPEVRNDAQRRAIVALASTDTDIFDAAGRALPGDRVASNWFDALREREPLVFGALADSERENALSSLSLRSEQLREGAEWLASARTLRGSPSMHRPMARHGSVALSGLSWLAEGPSAYAYALTEGVASREGDAYATRGLSHALDTAAEAARRALTREDLSDARTTLERLAQKSSSRARVCEIPRDKELLLRVHIKQGLISSRSYRAYRGESDALCASDGLIAGQPCAAPGKAFQAEPEDGGLTLELRVAEGDRTPWYIVESSTGKATIVAALGVPLDWPTEERCSDIPLSADLHKNFSRIHRDSVLAELHRVPSLPDATLTYSLSSTSAVPPLWKRTVTLIVDGTEHVVDLSQQHSTLWLRLERELNAQCKHPGLRGKHAGSFCAVPDLEAREASCLADAITKVADSGGGDAGGVKIAAKDENQKLSLALWAVQARQRELTANALAIEHFECVPIPEELGWSKVESDPESTLWARVELAARELVERYESTRGKLATAWEGAHAAKDGAARRIYETRGLEGSRLALARLSIGVSYGSYELESSEPSLPLAHALTRFPVVTFPALSAEDARAESFIRRAGLNPLLPGKTLTDGRYDETKFEDASRMDLANELRAALAMQNPSNDLPATGAELLDSLGISANELSQAAARVVQTAEAVGATILPEPGTGNRARGLSIDSYPADALHLHALTDVRAPVSATGWPTALAARGPYHAISAAVSALEQRARNTISWSLETTNKNRSVIAQLREWAAPGAQLTVASSGSVDVEIHAAAPLALDEARQRFELWWTDAGLRCAISGRYDGQTCDVADYRFNATSVRVSSGEQGRLRLSGFQLPNVTGWNPDASAQRGEGRIYLTEKQAGVRVPIASAALHRATEPTRSTWPQSSPLADQLLELLSHKRAGEGCRACSPRSVCETTACQLGVCVRSPLTYARPCGAGGSCVQGVCDKPGCGDGTRSDGSDGVPYEACDDGNWSSDDGCSAVCQVETRALEPLVTEAYPSGPAPSMASDELGNTLLVYTADTLESETVSLKAALFNPHGGIEGSAQTLLADVPRGYFTQPSAAGLRDGGFVVTFANTGLTSRPGVYAYLVGRNGKPGKEIPADDMGPVQSEPRVAGHGDGFVILWSERATSGATSLLKMRFFDANGEPRAGSQGVAPAVAGASQQDPSIAQSLDQILVTWTEVRVETGIRLGLMGRRYSQFGAVDERPFVISPDDSSESMVATLDSDDYQVVFTQRDGDPLGNIATRVVRRFGPPLASSTVQASVQSSEAEQRPVVAASNNGGFMLAYRVGTANAHTLLIAPGVDKSSVNIATEALLGADRPDLSMLRTPRGVWLSWSARRSQGRGLYVLQLPFDAPPTAQP